MENFTLILLNLHSDFPNLRTPHLHILPHLKKTFATTNLNSWSTCRMRPQRWALICGKDYTRVQINQKVRV